MAKFNRRSTAEQVSQDVDLSGKYALVTGANTGIGLETARVLALRGATVTMACRNRDKAEAARQKIVEGSKGKINVKQLDFLALDLNSLEAVRRSAAQFNSWNRPTHLLVNNAGIMIPMERRTDDGFEAHLGINHLGHFLFTHLILDSLKSSGGARVVNVSSGAMAAATLTPQFNDLNWKQRKFSGMRSYGDSKLMNLMFSRELTRRYRDEGIVSNALHPGIIATELSRDQSVLFMALGIFFLPFMKTVRQGAATSVYVAISSQLSNMGGMYFGNCNEWKPAHKLALNDAACETLWQRSCELTGVCS